MGGTLRIGEGASGKKDFAFDSEGARARAARPHIPILRFFFLKEL